MAKHQNHPKTLGPWSLAFLLSSNPLSSWPSGMERTTQRMASNSTLWAFGGKLARQWPSWRESGGETHETTWWTRLKNRFIFFVSSSRSLDVPSEAFCLISSRAQQTSLQSAKVKGKRKKKWSLFCLFGRLLSCFMLFPWVSSRWYWDNMSLYTTGHRNLDSIYFSALYNCIHDYALQTISQGILKCALKQCRPSNEPLWCSRCLWEASAVIPKLDNLKIMLANRQQYPRIYIHPLWSKCTRHTIHPIEMVFSKHKIIYSGVTCLPVVPLQVVCHVWAFSQFMRAEEVFLSQFQWLVQWPLGQARLGLRRQWKEFVDWDWCEVGHLATHVWNLFHCSWICLKWLLCVYQT